MDAFEQIIGQLLEEEKYWVRHSVKIDLLKDEKQVIGKATTPRPEIDIAAYDAVANKIYLLEVKSFLDSKGVIYEHVAIQQQQQSGRYKLLTSKSYRDVIESRLLNDWKKYLHVPSNATVSYGLIAGKVYCTKRCPNREMDLQNFFHQQGWLFWGPTAIKQRINNLVHKGYENNPVTIAAKILCR